MSPSKEMLVDTSVWARYLRANGPPELKSSVRQELDSRRVVTCWLVRSELLVGARDAGAFATLLDVLGAIPEIPIADDCWIGSARLRASKAGSPCGADLLIAQCAIGADCTLWHADSDFENVKDLSSRRTRYWQA